MFPETLHFDSDRPMAGKVFRFQLSTAGGTFRSDRRIAVDIAAWDECRECHEFDACYKLSMGKLALETAISQE
jgi:hypothetical protein